MASNGDSPLTRIERLATIFGISPSQLTALCANCGGHPPNRVRLPELRSLSPGMKPQPTGPVQISAGRTGAGRSTFGNTALPIALRRRSSSRLLRDGTLSEPCPVFR